MNFYGLILLIIYGFSLSQQNPLNANYTSQLLRQAKMAELMSYRANEDYACGSFYKQACNNWQKNFPASYRQPKTSHLDQIHHLYLHKCSELLKNYKDIDDAYGFVRKFYASCVNKEEMEKAGLAPVLKQLNFPLDWPMNQNFEWYQTEYDWLRVVADIRRDLGLNLFIGLELKAPVATGLYENVRGIHLGRPKLLMPKHKYLKADYENEISSYKQKISNKLQKNFPNMSQLWCWRVAEEVVSVERELAKGYVDNTKIKSNSTENGEQTVAQLKAKYGNYVDLSRYLNLVLNRTINEQVYEESSEYFSNLVQVIQSTNKLTMANYTMYRVLEHLGFIAEHIESDNNDIKCTEQSVQHFPQHVASLFATEFKWNAGDAASALINKIFNDVKRTLEIKFGKVENFAWMSPQVRQQANEHFGHINFPVPDAQALEKDFANVIPNIQTDQYYKNLMQILKFESNRELQATYSDQLASSAGVKRRITPHYEAEQNELIIPVEFVQSHFLYDAEYPQAINYGTLGVLLAQQMFHGLISSNKWWDNATVVNFQTRQDCFAKQILNYKFQGKPVNDKHGLLKYIIDVSALEIAYAAYSDWLKEHPKDLAAESFGPQFDYSDERLFFLSFGQLYCADYYVDAFHQLNELPERLIVNGALSNSAKFAELFKCGLNTRMILKNTCTIF